MIVKSLYILKISKESAREKRAAGPFYDMHEDYKHTSYHPLVAKEIDKKLKPGRARSVKLYLTKAGVRETYLTAQNQLKFKEQLFHSKRSTMIRRQKRA